jgi:hypothetical protein
VRYFLDAEFNGFGGALISIALVPDRDGLAPFYEAILCARPTEWVARHVLPVLGTQPRPRAEVARHLADYLSDDEEPLLVADWPEDIAHAARLLVTGPGRMSPVRSLRFELVDPGIIGPVPPSEVPHNACADAQALRAAVLDYERRIRHGR